MSDENTKAFVEFVDHVYQNRSKFSREDFAALFFQVCDQVTTEAQQEVAELQRELATAHAKIEELGTSVIWEREQVVIAKNFVARFQQERTMLIYWLLRAYESGHRQGWEAGPSSSETMDGLLDVLANLGYDPNLSPAAAALLKRKPVFYINKVNK